MQIRLTVVDPLGPHASVGGRAASCDVLVTAPAGTALAAVASALAAALPGGEGPGSGQVVLYAGAQRLDAQRSTLGEPPLIDGAVLCLGAPGEPDPHAEPADVPAQLHVVAGPDAGGVHLLHGGQIRLGRSADADVALDDPDVSRMHCAVTVGPDARVSVADLGSTNGTTLDGTRVGDRPVRFAPGALLRIGESALRLVPVPPAAQARVATTPDGEGHVRLSGAQVSPSGDGYGEGDSDSDAVIHARVADVAEGHAREADVAEGHAREADGRSRATAPAHGATTGPTGPARATGTPSGSPRTAGAADSTSPGATPHGTGTGGTTGTEGPTGARGRTHHAYGTSGYGTDAAPVEPPQVPGQGGAPRIESHGTGPTGGLPRQSPAGGETHGGAQGAGAYGTGMPAAQGFRAPAPGTPGEDAYGTASSTPGASRRGGSGAGTSGGGASGRGGSGTRPSGFGASGVDPSGTGTSGLGPSGAGAPGASRPGPSGADPSDVHPSGVDSSGADWSGVDSSGPDPSRPGPSGADPSGGRSARTSTDGSGAGSSGGRSARTGAGAAHPDASRTGAAGETARRPAGALGRTGGVGPDDGTGRESDTAPGTGTDTDARTGRKGTPLRGTDVPQEVRRRGGIGAWARRLTGGRGAVQEETASGTYAYVEKSAGPTPAAPAGTSRAPETWPDSASLLLTALGPGPRLWERGPGHPEALTVRLGTADRVAPGGATPLPAVPVTADLREVGALGLAGPRERLAGLARSVLAQLAALHSADALEIVLISADRSRPLAERSAEWSWLGWLPQLRPGHGQDCRLLLAHDREQATARAHELLRRLEDHHSDARPPTPTATIPAQPAPPAPDALQDPATDAVRHQPSWARPDGMSDEVTDPAEAFTGPYTVVVVDGDPGGADVRDAVARLALEGPRAGIHVVCLAETAAASPTSPVTRTYEAACAVSPVFRECGAVALLSGDVATTLRLLRVARTGTNSGTGAPAAPSGPVGHGTLGTVDAVSLPWAERFARALAPLRTDTAAGGGEHHARVSAPLPQTARLLDELGLARATPASLMARWADASDDAQALGGRAHAVLGAGPRGPVTVDLAAEGPHLLIEGPPGSGRTELLRALVASLASAERPDRLGVVLMDGRDSVSSGGAHGEGLRVCTDVPHVTTHLTANDPVVMREFAQALSAELKRRAELLGRSHFAEWHTGREVSGRLIAQRTPPAGGPGPAELPENGDVDSPPSSTMRLRPGTARRRAGAVPPLPRLVVVVDDLDALVTPPLGSPGRPAAGSVMRALEAVAREGERLGVHLAAATAPGGRTDRTEPALRATLRVTLDAPVPGPDEPTPGRGRLTHPDGRTTPFQGGRVTGRIPRTATLRPTVVPLEWHRMGDPPTRRPVRELGNGPTDLALLASALERAAREVSAAEVPSLL
ncbi:FHA domain-containing protein [Streptomyces sp. AC512_CC834]|uniref:FHA domain-containing protein n=1 Tax=Streptomyces sp. AC512_CC834 TaxID=2823691 RepID=UPI001C25E7F1|nr:FHA domain-containing protein [Streptomyces sp. AC512_CC834]